MGSLTAEKIAAIPGAISSAELFSRAVATGKKVKYYVLAKRTSKVLIRYVTPNGNITNGKGKKYNGFKHGVPRFTNYWHVYAYKLRVDHQQKEESEKW